MPTAIWGICSPTGPSPPVSAIASNSAALRFIPKEDLEKEGYGKYLRLFD